MSALFGVPPPPRPQVYEPGSAAAAAQRAEQFGDDDAIHYEPEIDPWRRRLAVLLTFVAVSLLVLGNLAAWLHFTGLNPRTASTKVAAATFDDVASVVVASVGDGVSTAVIDRSRSTSAGATTTSTAGESNVRRDVDTAVRAAVEAPAFRAAWAATLAATAERQRELGTGAEPTAAEQDGLVVELPTSTLAAPITARLVAAGYTYMAGVPLATPNFEVVTTDTAADHQAVVTFVDNLWWLLLLGAIACGAGAIYLASRRLRLGVIMAIDAAIMLSICVLLVPLVSQVVDDQAVDPVQQTLLQNAYGALSRTLVTQTVVLMVIALATAVVLGLIGRSRGRAEAAEPAP